MIFFMYSGIAFSRKDTCDVALGIATAACLKWKTVN